MDRKLSPDILNKYFPVGAIAINKQTKTARVYRRGSLSPGTRPPHSGNKKPIQSLSQSSLSELLFVVTNTNTKFESLLTLTFLCPPTCQQAKGYLNRFLVWLRRQKEITPKYLWFLEFQKRGSPHFHLLLATPYQQQLHMSIAEYWGLSIEPLNVWYYSLVRHKEMLTTDTVINFHKDKRGVWENIRKEDGVRRYVAKYALKTTQKTPPEWLKWTGRFWATDRETGKIDWSKFDIYPMNESTLRLILEDQDHPTREFDVIPRYLFNFTTE